MSTPTAVTIGNFDGVHLGHAALVRRCRELVGGGRVCVLAFDPHPMAKLRPGAAPAKLSTFEQRERWLRLLGADEVVRLVPNDELLSRTAREFVESLLAQYAPQFIVEGDDFHFGRARSGNVQTLKDLGRELGYQCDVVPPVEVALGDGLMVRASSSVVRWLIAHGRVADAARVLGRPYELVGTVQRGDQRGRTIGFPTANLRTDCLLPADGVYSGMAHLPDGRAIPAAVNVGARPTFRGEDRRLEAHLLDSPGGIEGYDWTLRVALISWLRDDLRFDSLESLVAQIERDCRRARQALDVRGTCRHTARSLE